MRIYSFISKENAQQNYEREVTNENALGSEQEASCDSHILAQVPEQHLGLELLGGGWDLGPKKDSSWSMVLSNTEIFWSVMVQIHASSIYS